MTWYGFNKVYTKTGDAGETSLVRGVRIAKDHPRVEAYGTTDELNSILGLVRCFNLEKPQSEERDRFEEVLRNIQNRLFDIGSLLATPPDAKRPPAKNCNSAKPTSPGWKPSSIP